MPLWFASNLLFLHYQSQPLGRASDTRFVVICFEFIIFALSITAKWGSSKMPVLLWFASNLLFLHYQSQPPKRSEKLLRGCDLLRIYYFCTINHSRITHGANFLMVVICFEFIIFALSITAISATYKFCLGLWFASNLLFLHYQSQLMRNRNSIKEGCDLLRIYYFCTINHSVVEHDYVVEHVVICFEFIIFALSITALT